MGRSPDTIWIASSDETLHREIWSALASQRMTPATVPADSSLEDALAKLSNRMNKAKATILDMAWIVAGRSDLPSILCYLKRRNADAPVFLVAGQARPVLGNAITWARSVGAAGLIPRLSVTDEPTVEKALALIFETLGAQTFDASQLRSQLRALVGPGIGEGPSATIRRLTAKSAEAVASEFAAGVEVADRHYGARRYPHCFVGSRGTDWLASRYGVDRAAAVAVGKALVQLGYVHHVLKEHDFQDAHLFYRVALPDRYAGLAIADLIRLLRQANGLIADRTWRGSSYPRCFVGQEAVDLLATQYGLDRGEAVAFGQSLIDLGIARHVTSEHDFTDGMLYFRFLMDESRGTAL